MMRINFYSDPKLKLSCSCYNYYQFLPLRSKTDIPADTFDSFLKIIKGSNTVMNNQGQAL